jgi:glycosyltransferase involved in cell wall biosynthesis
VSVDLSVVMPVYNEAAHVAATLEALLRAIRRSEFEADVIVVDDGSTDGSAAVVAAALGDRLPLTVLSQPNRGRFHAVREGLKRASGTYALVLGARVAVRSDALAFVHERQRQGELVWTGHVHIHADGNPYGTFQNVITEIAWRDYFDNPRTLSFGVKDFDRYPKGSGCFIAPRELLVDSFDAMPTRYADARYANDDTPMLRRLAASHRIHVSPSFASDYVPRATLGTFVKHSLHRGIVFLDGHGRRESRFFPAVLVFFPLSAGLAVASTVRPRLLLGAAGATSLAAGTVAVAARRRGGEVATVAALAPMWAAAFGTGLWRGLGMVVSRRVRGERR